MALSSLQPALSRLYWRWMGLVLIIVAVLGGMDALAFIMAPVGSNPSSTRWHSPFLQSLGASAAVSAALPSVGGSHSAVGCALVLGLAAVSLAARSRRRTSINLRAATRTAVTTQVAVGQPVVWKGRHSGIAQFVGNVEWAPGVWLGVELVDPKGWHDGTVFGMSYFQCKPNHGIFCQPADVAITTKDSPSSSSDSSSTTSSTSTEATPTSASKTSGESFTLGERVVWNGHAGIVKYLGSVQFSDGDWVGVELFEPNGMHDGSVFGVSYFDSKGKHGIFCEPSALSPAGGATTGEEAPAPSSSMPVASSPPSPVSSSTGGRQFQLGQAVSWNGVDAIVKYFGKVSFASGDWVGLELADAKGIHNGSVLGIEYFQCKPRHGVFCQPRAVTRGPNTPSATAVKAPSKPATQPLTSTLAGPSTQTSLEVGQRVWWGGLPGTIRFLGQVEFAAGEWIGVELDEERGLHDGNVLGRQYFQSKMRHGIFCQDHALSMVAPPLGKPVSAPEPMASPPFNSPSTGASFGSSGGALGSPQLGDEVTWNGCPGAVKFVGEVQFAAGHWVGVELREPKGMHDGSVFDVQYFEARPKHGVFAQPSALGMSGGGGSMSAAPATVAAAAAVAVPAGVAAPAAQMLSSPPSALGSSPPLTAEQVQMGQRVLWKGHAGAVRFLGNVDFAAGGVWAGVELDDAKGMHSGSLFGTTYFTCKEKHGIFCKPAELQSA